MVVETVLNSLLSTFLLLELGSLLSLGIQFRVESGNPRNGLHLSYVVGVVALSFPGIYDLQAPYLKEWPPAGGPEVLLLGSR